MNIGSIAAIAYGILTIAGGILGYAKVRSSASLGSGLVSGVLLVVGGLAQLQGMAWGLFFSIGVTLLLIAVFVIRLSKTRKFMPAGVMIVAGIFALAGLLLQLRA